MQPQHIFYTVPTGPESGLSTVSIGLVRALERQGVRVAFFKPIHQPTDRSDLTDRSTHWMSEQLPIKPPQPIALDEARDLVSHDKIEMLMEEVVQRYDSVSKQCDVLVVEGLLQTESFPLGGTLNKKIIQTLSAEVILVSPIHNQTLDSLSRQIEITAVDYPNRIAGVIINKAEFSTDSDLPNMDVADALSQKIIQECPVFQERNLDLMGIIPLSSSLLAPRTVDVANLINAKILNAGEMKSRRVNNIELCARTIPNMIHVMKVGNLLVTPADRVEIIMATALAAINGVQIAGLVLTGDADPNETVLGLCRKAYDTGLPVMRVNSTSFNTARALYKMNPEIPLDDMERVNFAMDLVARSLRKEWIRRHLSAQVSYTLSPPAFRHKLASLARDARKRIVLPEGDEPRTIQAAVACDRRGIAKCILLGKREDILHQAEAVGVELPDTIEIVEPSSVIDQYVGPMVELRKGKNLSEKAAREHLEDTVVLGTMMLQRGEVDGLVSGAVHSSANTVRPAFQLIKTQPKAKIVSSIFFMCLPDQVLIYGDCAINPNPNAEELADIAIQSADSAMAFGIEPVVAMISYSTLGSGSGSDVDKVVEATKLVKEMRPDLLVDGPLQYDAASTMDVATKKAPDSKVAGRATVFVFPDLNTGNTTYKAVQRSANIVSIGPMLQGLRKPVNDLSRGALVDDIIYTIALTAIQAKQIEDQA